MGDPPMPEGPAPDFSDDLPPGRSEGISLCPTGTVVVPLSV